MALKEGTELRCLDIGGVTITVGVGNVSGIRVGQEAGVMGWFATAEIYRDGSVVEVRPLHNLVAYFLADET